MQHWLRCYCAVRLNGVTLITARCQTRSYRKSGEQIVSSEETFLSLHCNNLYEACWMLKEWAARFLRLHPSVSVIKSVLWLTSILLTMKKWLLFYLCYLWTFLIKGKQELGEDCMWSGHGIHGVEGLGARQQCWGIIHIPPPKAPSIWTSSYGCFGMRCRKKLK